MGVHTSICPSTGVYEHTYMLLHVYNHVDSRMVKKHIRTWALITR